MRKRPSSRTHLSASHPNPQSTKSWYWYHPIPMSWIALFMTFDFPIQQSVIKSQPTVRGGPTYDHTRNYVQKSCYLAQLDRYESRQRTKRGHHTRINLRAEISQSPSSQAITRCPSRLDSLVRGWGAWNRRMSLCNAQGDVDIFEINGLVFSKRIHKRIAKKPGSQNPQNPGLPRP